MPGITLFNRRWNIGSDDLFYPALLELIVRSMWFFPQLFYFYKYNDNFECYQTQLLLSYYIGFLLLMIVIILIQFCIIIISARGTITNETPRKRMYIFIYARIFLTLCECTLSVMGSVWLSTTNWSTCSLLLCFTVLANILFCLAALSFLLIVTFIIFDPISHLPEVDYVKKRNILYERLKTIFCCCYCCLYTANSRSPHYENSYRQISSFLEMIFRGGDLTPSDVLAGTILLSEKEHDQFNREAQIHKRNMRKNCHSNLEEIPKWMNINESCYFIRYAVATYSWPYYIYMHNLRGFSHLCCNNTLDCCLPHNNNSSTSSLIQTNIQIRPSVVDGSLRNSLIVEADANLSRHMKAFKFLAKIEEHDILYANFNNELFLVPFCVLVDHFKKCVVITIRGTLSMKDVITDVTADCGYFDFDHIANQPCHSGMMITAENIFNKIKAHNLLEKAFRHNPNYQLLVTGHSLGAGTAVMLSLKLKKDYPNIRCIAYSPPGHLISKVVADYTKTFVLSVVLGDDIISRLSVRSVHNLKADILKEIYSTNLPKYIIYWKYSLSFFSKTNQLIRDNSVGSSDEDISSIDDSKEELDNSLNSVTSQHILIETNDAPTVSSNNLIDLESSNNSNSLTNATIFAIKNEDASSPKRIVKKNSLSGDYQIDRSKIIRKDSKNEIKASIKTSIVAYKSLKNMMKNVYDTYPERLVMPGNILYIYRIKTLNSNQPVLNRICSTIFGCFKFCKNKKYEIHYDSRWATQDEFKKIVITNRMLLDHFPNTVTDALTYFSSTDRLVV